ncbi:helix-turn-helix domain-containing protein [Adhaeribacter radiodurans]|uniref:Helix-turn-helix transcriptional regulator n=1 Tax=Adhaeribacter radiodurans TaxID=2745197 RepID=A0A7L7L5W2_9BACT|nr:AraC family transcriptional regulator [Adhaeribacter radiodurans]QMU27769.1 helix-turn-helix transcriptional regulator [Adhaeribacter radiodurans]
MERNVHIFQPNTSPENILIRQIWCIWDMQLINRTETILPKGTAEIIFNFSDDIGYFRLHEEDTVSLPKYFINGVNFTPYHLSIRSKQHFLGIQFNVFALKYIFNIPTLEFNDQVLEGSLICKSLDILAEQLSAASSFQQQVEVILLWLRNKVKSSSLLGANNRIIQLHADPDIINLSVLDLSEKYNVTPRHLSRLCNDYLGMCTEEIILYKKYLAALYQMHQPHPSLTEITYNCNFYDQAHFTRTFKLFTGLTPRQYKKTMGELPGHIFNFS